jgi:DNA polymerase-3 subunit chi
MTEIRFYHLQRSSLEQVLPTMLTRSLERGQRAVVMLSSEERVEALNAWLWTYDTRSFLPHGAKADGHAGEQPVWLTASDERPNGAEVLFLADGAESGHLSDYGLVAELFDGRDEEAVAAARSRWARYKEAGHAVTYWQQDERGRWQQKA